MFMAFGAYTPGRSVKLQRAEPPRLQIPQDNVNRDAAGGGEAAASRTGIHRSPSNLCTETPGKVCSHRSSCSVHKGALEKASSRGLWRPNPRMLQIQSASGRAQPGPEATLWPIMGPRGALGEAKNT